MFNFIEKEIEGSNWWEIKGPVFVREKLIMMGGQKVFNQA